MSHLTDNLMPSPTWYLAKVLDVSLEGYLAYGNRRTVIVLNVKNIPTVVEHFNAHEHRVLSVAFNKSNGTLRLATTCESGAAKVWQFQDKAKQIWKWEPEHSKMSVVEWKHGVDNIMFVGHSKTLREWNLTLNVDRAFRCGIKDDILNMVSCPSDSSILALGHKGGLVTLIDILKYQCTHRLRGHTGDVTTLSWCPMSTSQLVSSGTDGSTRVWTALPDGEAKFVVHVSHVSSKADSAARSNRCWVSAIYHPTRPDMIIGTNFFGNLMTWNGSERKSEKSHFRTEAGGHDKTIYSILINLANPNILITYGLDRQIVFWDIELNKSILRVPTLSATTCALEFSPHDSDRLAIATRDGSLHIWNTTITNKVSMKSHGQGMKGAVASIAWHPTQEGLLAFSADDGRVGLLETFSAKYPSYFHRCHYSTVYSLSWAPCHIMKTQDPDLDVTKLFLYSCGNGKIFVHQTGMAKGSFHFDELIGNSVEKMKEEKIFRTEISWKPDYSLVAIGNDSGDIEIYNGVTFALIAKIQVIKKQIQKLIWHREFISLTSEKCRLHCWLAVGSIDKDVYVFDLSNIQDHCEGEVQIVETATRQLKGHMDKVPQICWSPHVEGQLVTASYDGTSQVWDVLSGLPIANFRGHNGRVFCASWSFGDPDVIICGGEDNFVYKWKISEQTYTEPPKKAKQRNRKKKNDEDCVTAKIGENANGAVADTTQEAAVAEAIEPSSYVENEIKGDSDEEDELADPEGAVGTASDIRKRYPRTRTFLKSSISSMAKRDRKGLVDDTMKLVEELTRTDDDTEVENTEVEWPPYMAIFRDRDSFYKMFEEKEIVASKELRPMVLQCDYEVWRGNIKGYILDAVEKGYIMEHHLAIAAHVSRSFWLETCEKYANQLISKRMFPKAVLYLLLCNKGIEAINIMKDYCSPRDALGLAKLRLPESDPIIAELYEMWSTNLCNSMQFESAANCFLSVNKPLEAAAAVSKRNDALAFKLAAHICRKYGHEEEAKNYVVDCVKLALLSNKWDIAREAVALEPSLKGLLLVLDVHESIRNELDAEDKGFGFKSEAFVTATEEPKAIWKCHMVEGKTYLQHLAHCLKSAYQSVLDDAELLEVTFQKIKLLIRSIERNLNVSNIVYAVSLNVSLFYLSILPHISQNKNTIEYLNAALFYSLFALELNFLDIILQLLFPFDIIWHSDEHKFKLTPYPASEDNYISFLESTVVNTFDEEKIPLSLCRLTEDSLLCSSEDLIGKIEHIVKSMNSSSSFLTFFVMNLIDRVRTAVEKNNLDFKSELSKKNTRDDTKIATHLKIEKDVMAVGDASLANGVTDAVVNGDGQFTDAGGDREVIIAEELCGDSIPVNELSSEDSNVFTMCTLLQLCGCFVTKDVYIIRNYLSKQKQKVEAALLTLRLRLKSKVASVSIDVGKGENMGTDQIVKGLGEVQSDKENVPIEIEKSVLEVDGDKEKVCDESRENVLGGDKENASGEFNKDVSCYNVENVSVDNKDNVSDENVGNVPAEDQEKVSERDKEKVSDEMRENVLGGDKENASGEVNENTSECGDKDVPIDNIENVLVDNKDNVSGDNVGNVPAEDQENVSERDKEKVSESRENVLAGDKENASEGKDKVVSCDDIENGSMENKENGSVNNKENGSVENKENGSVNNKENGSVENKDSVSGDIIGNVPAEDQENVCERDKENVSAENKDVSGDNKENVLEGEDREKGDQKEHMDSTEVRLLNQECFGLEVKYQYFCTLLNEYEEAADDKIYPNIQHIFNAVSNLSNLCVNEKIKQPSVELGLYAFANMLAVWAAKWN